MSPSMSSSELTEELAKLVENIQTRIAALVDQEGCGPRSISEVGDAWPEVTGWVDLQLLGLSRSREWCLWSGGDTGEQDQWCGE